MKKNLALVAFSTTVALLFVELVLRIFWSNPYAGSGTDKILKIRVPHADINQVLDRSQIDKENPSVLYRTNGKHYIEPANQFDNPHLTIAFLGGSTTESIAVDEQKRFPFLVSRLLENKGIKSNTLNVARAGGTLHDSVNVLLNHVTLDYPDIAVLMHATNDIGVLKKDSEYSSRMGSEVSLVDIGKYLTQILSSRSALTGFVREAIGINGFQKDDNEDYFSTQIENMEPFRARLKIFIEICRAFEITPILMTQPIAGNIKNKMTPQWVDLNAQEEFNQTIRKVGVTNSVDVIDLEAHVFDYVQNEKELNQLFYDGMHVTDKGSILYANHIAERIYNILKPENR